MNRPVRANLIDVLRTLAIIWMVIFHFSYDLRALGFTQTNFSEGFWYYFPRVIAGSFLFIVGISLHLAYKDGIIWSKFWRRQIKIIISAIIISIATYIIFPQNWVYFGTLHCIFMSTLLGVFFVKRTRAIIAVILLISVGLLTGHDLTWVSSLIQKPSMDFIPIYPWFICTLLGLLVSSFEGFWRFVYNCRTHDLLALPGRHSLMIYLLHQPIIFGSLTLIKNFFFK